MCPISQSGPYIELNSGWLLPQVFVTTAIVYFQEGQNANHRFNDFIGVYVSMLVACLVPSSVKDTRTWKQRFYIGTSLTLDVEGVV